MKRVNILLYGVGDQRQDLLILVQQQTRGQVSETLVRKPARSQQLYTFDLTEMCPLPQGEEVEKLRDIVASAFVMSAMHAYPFMPCEGRSCAHRMLWSLLSSLKLALMAALSF